MLTGITQDIRYAVRGFLKSPLFAGIAILSVAIGIGANAAIFSLIDQVLLRPLPVAHPDRLVMLDLPGGRIGSTFTDFAFSNPMYRGLRDRNASFEQLIAVLNDQANLSFRGRSETVPVAVISGNYFTGLGVQPAMGRLIEPNDDITRNGHPVVVLSYGYFNRRFGGDTSVIGQNVRLNSQLYQVIGVAPRGFSGLEIENVPSLYVPLAQKTQITTTWDGMDDPNFYFLHVFGTLKPGITTQAAKANLDSLVAPMIEDELKNFPSMPARGQARFRARRFAIMPAGTPLVGDRQRLERALYLLLGVVGLVLLIACANVANLLLARASSRVREVAIRMALGAGRARLARQLLVESSLLGLLGGVVGMLLSIWILDAIIAMQNTDPGVEIFINSAPNWRVAAFCFAISLLTGLLFGIAPALRGAGFAIVETLKENAAAVIGQGSQGWLRRALVVAQVTLSLVLLVAAGLFARSLMNLRQSDTGFKPDYLLSFRIDPSLNGYEQKRAINFLDRFRKDIEALPGVRDVTVASVPLLENSVNQATMSIEGYSRREGLNTNSRINDVGPGFFKAMGFPLLQGREFTEADQSNALPVAIVNEVFSKEFFNGNAVGKRVGFGYNRDGSLRLNRQIIGVIRDGKTENIREATPQRFVYTPYAQADNIQSMTFYVRSERDPQQLATDVRASLRRIDDNLAMFRVQTMSRTIENSLRMDRMMSMLCSSFGLLATILAAIGLYGVMAFNVARRTREIGIRLALGAERTTLIHMVMREVGAMIFTGLLIGLPAALALGRYVESQLWGLKGWDPLILSGASFTLTLVACLAGLVPAWRASRVSPMRALRYE
jgi:predicted permease